MKVVTVLVALVGCSDETPVTMPTTSVSIAAENALAGDPDWRGLEGAGDDAALAAFARPLSVSVGERVSVQASASRAHSVRWAVHRMGFYGGVGARLVASGGPLTVEPQDECDLDRETGMIECHWPALFTFEIARDWPSGLYLVRLEGEGATRYAPFIVRDARPAQVVAVLPTATDQAYNPWGGESLYLDENLGFPIGHAYQVSFDRPLSEQLGRGILFGEPYMAIQWLEANGYDVTYLADHDVARAPSPLERARIVLILGHDEYWSRTMRDRYEAARDAGVSLAFLGANIGYWQIRSDPAWDGMPDRRITSYKEAADLDPMKNTPDVTDGFQFPRINRPENALLGIMMTDWHMVDFPWRVADAGHWIYAGTGLATGNLLPALVGIESDAIVDNGHTPPGLAVVADSPNIGGQASGLNHQQATVYETPAGGFVFAAGSIRFASGLAGVRASPRAQELVHNLLARVGATPSSPVQTLGATELFESADTTGGAARAETMAGSAPGLADGPGATAQFRSPLGLALAADGALLVADSENHRLRRIETAPPYSVTTLAGNNEGEGSPDDDGPLATARFRRPWGVAAAADGTIYVSEPRARRLRRIARGMVSTVAQARATGVAVGADGTVYFADLFDGRVRALDAAGKVRVVADGAKYPTGVLVDGARLWVVDSGHRRLRAVDAAATAMSLASGPVIGNGEGGFADGPGDQARLGPVLGLARLDNVLLLADAGNYRIRRIDLDSSRVRTFATDLIAPTGIAVDSATRRVFVSDTGNSRIRILFLDN